MTAANIITNPPKKPIVDTDRMEVGDEIAISQRGPLPKSLLDDPRMVSVAEPDDLSQNRIEQASFMEELLEILVHEPMEGSGEGFVILPSVNCVMQPILRGHPQKVKRKYVEILARCRRAGISAWGYKDGTGEAVNDFRKSTRALEYPFQVLHDPSGQKGAAWLAKILRSDS